MAFTGSPLSLRSICRLKIRRCFGRERLGLLPKLQPNQQLTEFLSYREFYPSPYERDTIFSNNPAMEMMIASLTHLMKDSVSPKDLPNYIALHLTTFEGYGDEIEDPQNKLNARVQALSNPLRLLNKDKPSQTFQAAQASTQGRLNW